MITIVLTGTGKYGLMVIPPNFSINQKKMNYIIRYFSSSGKDYFCRILRSSRISVKVELTNTRKILVCWGILQWD